jgi:hypothetical protein
MSTATHATELPSVDDIDRRLQSCFEEMQALKKLRRAAIALAQAEAARQRRQQPPVREGVRHER